jgi:hypothetical protein
MAGETTPTTTVDRQVAALLTAQALHAGLPDVVLAPLCNTHDIMGQASLVVDFAVEADDGIASAATYGTALSSNNEFDYATKVTVTVVEGAAVLGEVLDTAIEVKFPGMGSITEIMANGTTEQKVAALSDEARRSVSMCMEKLEKDHADLLDNFSVSVDGSGVSGGQLTIADVFSAIYSYDTAENITRDTALFLWPVQVRDIRLDLAVTGGGMGGAVWNQQADASFLSSRGLPQNGFLGTLLGRPLYQGSHSLRNLSDTNVNVNGGLIAIGKGSPAGGQLGALVNVTRGGPRYRITQDAKVRGVIMSTVMEFKVAEIRDAHGIRIRSRAT